MTLDQERCDACGASVDQTDPNSIARFTRHPSSEEEPDWHLWCNIECRQRWVLRDTW